MSRNSIIRKIDYRSMLEDFQANRSINIMEFRAPRGVHPEILRSCILMYAKKSLYLNITTTRNGNVIVATKVPATKISDKPIILINHRHRARRNKLPEYKHLVDEAINTGSEVHLRVAGSSVRSLQTAITQYAGSDKVATKVTSHGAGNKKNISIIPKVKNDGRYTYDVYEDPWKKMLEDVALLTANLNSLIDNMISYRKLNKDM